MERSQTSSEGKQAEDGFFRGDHFLFTYTIAFIHEPYNIFIMSTRCIPAHKAAQAGRQTGEQVRKGAFLLFGGDLCSFPGDGVLHGLQLFQQLLATGQCVARFVGARAGARAGG